MIAPAPGPARRAARLAAGLGLALLLVFEPPSRANDRAAATPAATVPAPGEAELRERLTAVRDRQRALTRERDATLGEHAGELEALRADDEAIAAAAAELARIDAVIEARGAEAERLAAEQSALERGLAGQRAALAALLRSAYALGRHDQLRILFAPERVGEAARLLAYHRYLARDRRRRIAALAAELAELTRVTEALAAARAALAAARSARVGEVTRLEAARAARAARLAGLERRIADQEQRLALLGKDEKTLLGLLERLRDAIGDIPRRLSGSEPFASLRGRVPWPADGRVLARFGAPVDGGRQNEGLLIGAAAGSRVRAVWHGRVAYADWLSGYGLLAIVDHGDGYMSLYAHNEALLAEVGDWVDAGDAIATVGASGGVAGTGLYFELRRAGQPLDPMRWLSPRR